MRDRDIERVAAILARSNKRWKVPIVTVFSKEDNRPFKVLVSCILSLRTKDAVTEEASKRLFKLADSPEKLMTLSQREIEEVIYPAGFYKVKAENLKNIASTLFKNYACRVPDSLDELLKLKGVGRKTANLVLTLGYDKPGICVDTHVHRICNRLGYVSAKTPEDTEFALREKLPKRLWKSINDLLVTHGQNVCRPISPICSKCQIAFYCEKVGVAKSR